MHQIEGNQNDWDGVANDELSVLQKIAKKTKGIATVGNTITLSGFILISNGLADFANGQKGIGTTKVIAGKLCDVADGKMADVTGTKGKVGEAFDVTADGVELLAGLAVLQHVNVIPTAAAAAVALPKIADATGSLAAKWRGHEIHPTDESKIGATLIVGGLGTLMLKSMVDKHAPGLVDAGLETIGWTAIAGGTINKLPATKYFLETGFSKSSLETPTIGE